MLSHILQHFSGDFATTVMIRSLRSSGVSWVVLKTLFFMCPHKKSIKPNSGERGVHSIKPLRRIQWSGKFLSNSHVQFLSIVQHFCRKLSYMSLINISRNKKRTNKGIYKNTSPFDQIWGMLCVYLVKISRIYQLVSLRKRKFWHTETG